MDFRYNYAARLNSFRNGDWNGKKPSTIDLIQRAAKSKGLKAVDLNYPDHLQGVTAAELSRCMADSGIALSGFAMRFYTEPEFKLGAFTHPDKHIRKAAVDLTRRGIDEMRRLGGTVPATGPARRSAAPEPAKRPLVERINDPRVARLVRGGGDETQQGNPRRVSGFLKALDGEGAEAQKKDAAPAQPGQAAGAEAPATDAKNDEPAKSGEARKSRLLDRITGLNKTSA